MPLPEMWKEAERIQLERITVSGLISNVPSLVYHAVICGKAGGAGDAQMYDGSNTQGDYKIDLKCAAETLGEVRFDPPQLFRKGIYVVIGSKVISVIVRFTAHKE